MYFLGKFLPVFVLPLGVSLILLVWGVARHRRRLAWAGILVLVVSSNSFVGRYLIRATEDWAERRPVAAVTNADAVVVLSAGRTVAPGPERASEWNDANRFFGGVDLMLAGKAPLLVFTGAATHSPAGGGREGALLAEQAMALGVSAEHIAVTGLVRNTADEAREVAGLLRTRHAGAPRILLVTSAFHMRRARLLFEQQGMLVDPFPVSFWSSEGGAVTPLSFLPSVSALGETQMALREFYGRAFYWLRARLVPGTPPA